MDVGPNVGGTQAGTYGSEIDVPGLDYPEPDMSNFSSTHVNVCVNM